MCSFLKEIQAIFKTGLPQIHHQQTPPTHCGPPAEGQGLVNHRTEGWHLTNEGSWQIHASAYHTPDMVGCFYMVLHSGIVQQVWYVFIYSWYAKHIEVPKYVGNHNPKQGPVEDSRTNGHKQFPWLPHQTTSKQEKPSNQVVRTASLWIPQHLQTNKDNSQYFSSGFDGSQVAVNTACLQHLIGSNPLLPWRTQKEGAGRASRASNPPIPAKVVFKSVKHANIPMKQVPGQMRRSWTKVVKSKRPVYIVRSGTTTTTHHLMKL